MLQDITTALNWGHNYEFAHQTWCHDTEMWHDQVRTVRSALLFGISRGFMSTHACTA